MDTEAAERVGYEKGLREALSAVQKNADRYVQRGLSPLSFWIGILNISFSGFILGRFPEYFWLWQVIKCIVLLFVAFRVKLQDKEHLYMLDFCWVFAIFYSLSGVCSLLEHVWPWFDDFYQFPTVLFLGFWGIANGPLAWACLLLSNALVLHDPKHMSGLFIHISPMYVTWTIRWHCSKVAGRWPELFELASCSHEAFSSIGLWDIVTPALYMYFVWWIPYTLYMIISGRFESVSRTGRDTVYYSTLVGMAAARSTLGIKESELHSRAFELKFLLQYLLWHAALCTLGIFVSYCMFHSMLIHTAFALFVLMYCSYLGALRYNHMMTSYYIKTIQALKSSSSKEKHGLKGKAE